MNTVTVLCDNMDARQLHVALKSELNFPDYYGENLDSLYDCLTDISDPTRLILQTFPPLPGFRKALEDAQAANPCFEVEFR